MNNKQIITGKAGREKVLAGIEKAADAVKHTLGVVGKSAMISNGNFAPTITDDGVTVLKNIVLSDPFENMGAQLLKRVAVETNEKAGDGTTTSAVLARALVKACFEEIGDDSSKVHEIVQRLNTGLKDTIAVLEKNKKMIENDEDIRRIATISCLDEELGAIIADTIIEAGPYGVVTVDESLKLGVSKEVVKGLRIDGGFLNQYFVENQERGETILENAQVVVTDARLLTNKHIKSLLLLAKQTGNSNLVIFAEEIAGEALATLTINFHGKHLRVVPIKVSGSKRKEILKDIAVVAGAQFVTEEMGKKIDDITLMAFGGAGKVIINKGTTTILGGLGTPTPIEARCRAIELEVTQTDSEVEKEGLKSRLASLAGGIGVIRVGAYSDTELQAKKYKIEDAINATRCAIEEGILPGGGTALMKSSIASKEILFKVALSAPLAQMAVNAGLKEWAVSGADFWTGIDFKNGETKDLYEAGILDPFKVTRLALENAVSVASTLITSETFIVDEPEHEQRRTLQQLDIELDSR
jgi:chaperonin GroEL